MRRFLFVLCFVMNATACLAADPMSNDLHNSASDVHLDQDTFNQIVAALKDSPAMPIGKTQNINAVPANAQNAMPAATPSNLGAAAPSDPNYTQKIIATSDDKQSAVDEILGRDQSQLERAYSTRAHQRLTQFGYDMFSANAAQRNVVAAASDDYVLGIGDTLTVTYRGARNDKQNYTVNREGQVLIEGLAPLMAAGRSYKAVTDEMQAQVHANVLNTDAFVSLEKVRQIAVQVLGEVKKPGRTDLNSFSTVMDALNAAGGIRKTGTLRQITLSRGDGWARKIDLYHLLLSGSKDMDMPLQDGDKILIPPIGPTIAVSGDIKRAGIYELPEGNQRLTMQQTLYLAGETGQPAGLKIQTSRIEPNGRENTLAASSEGGIADGDIVIAQRFDSGTRGAVELSGDVRSPGQYAVNSNPTLRALLGDGGVANQDAYPLMGVIERYNRKTLSKELIPFAPNAVANGEQNQTLSDGDKVKLLTGDDMKVLVKLPVNNDAGKRSAFGLVAPDSEDETNVSPLQQLANQQKISLRGAVNNPGGYPVASDTTLEKLIAAGGGLRSDADKSSVEIVKASKGLGHDWEAKRDIVDLSLTDPGSVKVPAGSSVRINQNLQVVNTHGVTIAGEVRRPGTYDLMRGEKLTSLIERAGGYTDEAYPQGTLFTRESARRREADLFRKTADELDVALSRTLSTAEKPPSDTKVNTARAMVNELRNSEAVGRITVEADPSVLAVRPDLDPLLEGGDKVYVPKRTINVHVAGEVFSPSSLKFASDKDAGQYIEEAGGVTRLADDSKSFVVLPDGSARPLYVSSWNHENVQIPPGSTIIVPRDPDPVSFLQLTNSLGSIFSQLAVSSAALASINRDR